MHNACANITAWKATNTSKSPSVAAITSRLPATKSKLKNVMFIVTIYTIFCYDTTGRLLGQLLGLNM